MGEAIFQAIEFWFIYHVILTNANCLLHHSNLTPLCLDLTAPSLPAKLPRAREAERLKTED